MYEKERNIYNYEIINNKVYKEKVYLIALWCPTLILVIMAGSETQHTTV